MGTFESELIAKNGKYDIIRKERKYTKKEGIQNEKSSVLYVRLQSEPI